MTRFKPISGCRFILIVDGTSGPEAPHHDVERLVCLLLLKSHYLSDESTRFRNRTFPLGSPADLQRSCGCLGRDFPIVINFPPYPAFDSAICSLNAVGELSSIHRARQNVWKANNEEADSQRRCKERARRPTARVEMMHLAAGKRLQDGWCYRLKFNVI